MLNSIKAATRSPAFWLLVLLIIIVVLLRLPMLQYGMPFDLGDEDENGFIGCALNYGATMSLKPILTWYPAFYTYVLAGAFGVFFILAFLFGYIDGTTDFAVLYLMYPGTFHFVGRLVSIIFISVAVVLMYHCGKRYQSRSTGLIAAGFFACSTMVLTRTSWALPDSTYLLMTILSIWCITSYMESKRFRLAMASGLFCGLAIATKYNVGTLMAIGVSGIFLAHWDPPHPKGLMNRLVSMSKVKAFYAYGLLVVVGFLLGTPYFFFDIPLHLSGLKWEIGRLGIEPSGSSNLLSRLPYVWIISELVVWERGLGLLVVIGLFVAIYGSFRGEPAHWLFLPYLLATVLIIGRYQKHSLHYLVPAFPALFLAAAAGLDRLSHTKRSAAIWLCIGLLAALTASAPKVLALSAYYTNTDTRLVASKWIRENIPTGALIAIGRTIHAPPLRDANRFSKPNYSMISEQILSRRLPIHIKKSYKEKSRNDHYRLIHYLVRQSEGRKASYAEMMSDFTILPIDSIEPFPPDFVIYSSYDNGYLKRIGYNDFLDIPGFNEQLAKQKVFSPTDGYLVGPKIVIYSVRCDE